MSADPVDLPNAPVEFARHGLGWRYQPPNVPVVITFDRIVERRDEVSAELHVTLRSGGHLLRRRLNLLGSRSLNDMAKDLEAHDGGTGWPWRDVLASGCEATLEAYREGSPVQTIRGKLERPGPVRWHCHELVMADVINCWVAAASTGKSTFAKAYCYAIATGGKFLGRETQPGVPLYIDYEDTIDSFRETMYRLSVGAPIPPMHWLRGGGPISQRVNQIAETIDRLGVTDIVFDAVAAMTGAMGDRSYEAVAGEIEQAMMQLPPVTVLLLDHITGDELKSGAIPLKARGGSRKYEFIRYQWTMAMDREESGRGRHVVGWTHTKTNRTKYFKPFGIEVFHEAETLAFGPLVATDVAPVRDQMTMLDRAVSELQDENLKLDELADRLGVEPTRSKRESLRILLHRNGGRQVRLTSDGFWTVRIQNQPTRIRQPYADEGLPF